MTQQLLQFLNGELYHNHHCDILHFLSSHSSDSNFMFKHKGPVLPDHLFLFIFCNVTMLGYKLQETSASFT